MNLSVNEHGTLVSLHTCDACEEEFTVCPPVEHAAWGGCCLAEKCESYDPVRDADKMFDSEDPRIGRS